MLGLLLEAAPQSCWLLKGGCLGLQRKGVVQGRKFFRPTADFAPQNIQALSFDLILSNLIHLSLFQFRDWAVFQKCTVAMCAAVFSSMKYCLCGIAGKQQSAEGASCYAGQFAQHQADVAGPQCP